MTGIIWACIATFLIAVSPVLAKAGTKKTDPALAGCVVGITYAIVTFIRTSGRITAYKYSYIEQKSWIFIILAGAAAGFFAVCLFRALDQGEATNAVPIMKCNYVITGIAAIFVFGTKPDIKQWVVMGLMVLGTVVITMQSGGKKKNSWLAYAVLSAILISTADLLVKYGAGKIDEYVVKFICIVIGLVVLLIVTFATGGMKKIRNMSFVDGVFLILSALAIPAAEDFYSRAAALAGNYAAYIYDVSLLVMMIIASVSLKEKISGLKIAGAVVFISSLYLQIMW